MTPEQKEHRRLYAIEYRKTHREMYRKAAKKWAAKNMKKRTIYGKQYRDVHRKEEIKREKNNKLKLRYGITLAQYNSLFKEQKGCCAICGTHQDNLKRGLAVDHNHNTGMIRALLCSNCNLLVGNSGEDIGILNNVIKYLKNHSNDTV